MYFLMFKGSFQDLRFRVLEFEGFRFLGFGGAPPGVILTFGMVQGLTFCREREREAGGGGGEEGEEGGSNHNPTFTSIRSPVPPGSHKRGSHTGCQTFENCSISLPAHPQQCWTRFFA